MKTSWLLSVLLSALLFPGALSAQENPLPDIKAVTQNLDDLFRSKASHGELKMDIVTANWSRTLEMEMWTKGEDFALIVIRSPAKEAGTATLRTDEGLWNYAPRADRMMRVPTGMLSDGWMGSHFTNDDMMRESSWEDDYDTVLSWEKEGDTTYLVATSTPKPDAPVVYTKVVQWMTEKDWIPVRAMYYDGEELVRTMTFDDIKEMGGRRIPTLMTIIPADAPDEKTQFSYVTIEFDIALDDDLFTARGLRKAAQK
ncbi:MAG: outer membrane lipoprotein-sorting protein [Deltaproteobacteria bacterium CG17_big_fil_post_rev_8_21_14_2_50_63_7]|nr:MAG: outer membrane lipoprotein-sorting protein [Deltaproteobacteria bacterium CG17_big_fil_post_rev_8_21_14_2_50_63_7]